MPKHLTVDSAVENHNQVFPGFGSANAVTVPADVAYRIITAVWQLSPTGTDPAILDRHVTPNGGLLITKRVGRSPSGLGGDQHIETTLIVGPGDAYYWTDVSTGTAAVTNTDYSYVDVK